MPQWTLLLPLVGPVLTALIAGAVAFLASVLSKEHKVSEFRQAWIDALRSDLAELVSLHLLLNDVIATSIREATEGSALKSVMLGKQAEFLRLEAAVARVRLRLNPNEHQVLLKAVRLLGELSPKLRHGDVSDSNTRGEAVIIESQRVLKAEWGKVKRGEFLFVVTKRVSLAIIVLALSVLVWGALSVIVR